MPKKKGERLSQRVDVAISEKLAAYLDDLVLEEGYGNSRVEVARTLVWRGIEDLLSRGILNRRPGRFQPDEEPRSEH